LLGTVIISLICHTCTLQYVLSHHVLWLLHFNFMHSRVFSADIFCLVLTCYFLLCDIVFKSVWLVLYIAAEKRDERVKFILESDVISRVRMVLTSVPQYHQVAIRLIAELVKTGTW